MTRPPFVLGVTREDLGETEPMQAGDQFVPYPDQPPCEFRIVDVATGEPIEPGPGGTVTVPRAGFYRIEEIP